MVPHNKLLLFALLFVQLVCCFPFLALDHRALAAVRLVQVQFRADSLGCLLLSCQSKRRSLAIGSSKPVQINF